MSVSSRTSQLDDGMEGPSSMFQDPTAAARTNKARPKRKHSSTEAESALWDNLRVQDEAALEASVEAIRENTISKKSRKMYTSSMIRLLQWLYVNRKEVLTKEFRELMERQNIMNLHYVPDKDLLHDILTRREIKPIDFENKESTDPKCRFTSTAFITWLEHLRSQREAGGNSENGAFAFSTLSGHRSGLFDLYRHYGFEMPSDLSNSLRKDFKGVKRTVAKGASETKDVKVSSGKDPLSFEGYKILGNFSLKQTGTEWIFFRTMLIICWNLICRANNGIKILYNHMEFFEDALKIYIIHQKNDQEGDRPRDGKHIYANPLNPDICPLLALGK